VPQIGGTIEEMQALSSTFTREAGNVSELTSTVDGQVANTWWVGPAADRFREAWQSQFKPMLANLQTALDEASTEVRNRANALQQAGQ
jgi:WXG100 family type VII secretion target